MGPSLFYSTRIKTDELIMILSCWLNAPSLKPEMSTCCAVVLVLSLQGWTRVNNKWTFVKVFFTCLVNYVYGVQAGEEWIRLIGTDSGRPVKNFSLGKQSVDLLPQS